MLTLVVVDITETLDVWSAVVDVLSCWLIVALTTIVAVVLGGLRVPVSNVVVVMGIDDGVLNASKISMYVYRYQNILAS